MKYFRFFFNRLVSVKSINRYTYYILRFWDEFMSLEFSCWIFHAETSSTEALFSEHNLKIWEEHARKIPYPHTKLLGFQIDFTIFTPNFFPTNGNLFEFFLPILITYSKLINSSFVRIHTYRRKEFCVEVSFRKFHFSKCHWYPLPSELITSILEGQFCRSGT